MPYLALPGPPSSKEPSYKIKFGLSTDFMLPDYTIIINVNLIHMYMIAGFQQEAAFGCQSISNLFRGAALLDTSVQANRTKPVSTRTPNLLLRIP